MSEKDKINYPNQYPKLKFSKIFKDNDPLEFLISLIEKSKLEMHPNEYKSFKAILGSLQLTEELLAEKRAVLEEFRISGLNEESFQIEDLIIAIENQHPELNPRNSSKINQELKENYSAHPLLNNCPNPTIGSSVVKNLLSISYSKTIKKDEMTVTLEKLITKPIVNEILAITAMDSSYSKNALSVFLENELRGEYYVGTGEIGGLYHKHYNNIKATLDHFTFTHELSHKALDILFNNDAKPYNLNSKEKYHHAIKNTLINILEFFKDAGIMVNNITDQTNSYQMGKALVMALKQPIDGIDQLLLSETELSIINDGLLGCYHEESYTKINEDAEFIVALPSIIAAGFYEGKIEQILQPLEQYWQEVISPTTAEYLNKQDPSEICLPLGDLQELLP